MKHSIRLLAAVALAAMIPAGVRSQEPTKPRPTNVRLTFHIIEADGFQGDDAEIRPIVTELRRVFRFRGYRLVTTSVLAGTSWPGSVVSQQVATDSQDRVFMIEATIDGDGMGSVRLSVRLDGHFVGTDPARREAAPRLIEASVNLQDGKTVVLGSSRQVGQSAAIILAVTPQINP